jgi:uncharacterized protein YjbI with pentapeptide repeats
VDLRDARLTGIDVTGAFLTDTVLTGATGAPRARLDRAIYCDTTLPDGAIALTDC